MFVGCTLLVAPTSSAVLCVHVLVFVHGQQVGRLQFQVSLPLASHIEWLRICVGATRCSSTAVTQHFNELS
jgi:hypothetical protein